MTLVLGAILGILLVVSLLTTVSCLYSQCCMLYKRRTSKFHGGPHYRLQCSHSGISASASGGGVANMYSFSTQNSAATTPLDTTIPGAAGRLSRDVSQDVPSSGGADHILVDVQCEIVPQPGPNSFMQLSSPSSQQLPDVAESVNTSQIMERMQDATSAVPTTSSEVGSSSTLTSPSMVVSELPSQTSFTAAHNRNLSTSTAGGAGGGQTSSSDQRSSETNSSTAALSISFRSSCHSHDSGYSMTSDMVNVAPSNVASPTPKDENLYRSTKF